MRNLKLRFIGIQSGFLILLAGMFFSQAAISDIIRMLASRELFVERLPIQRDLFSERIFLRSNWVNGQEFSSTQIFSITQASEFTDDLAGTIMPDQGVLTLSKTEDGLMLSFKSQFQFAGREVIVPLIFRDEMDVQVPLDQIIDFSFNLKGEFKFVYAPAWGVGGIVAETRSVDVQEVLDTLNKAGSNPLADAELVLPIESRTSTSSLTESQIESYRPIQLQIEGAPGLRCDQVL